MEYNGKSKEEYIAELKKKYGELLEPELFDDDIYIKIEESEEDIKNGRYFTIEECDRRMKEKFPFLRDNYDISNDKFIAEEGEKYNVT